MKYKAVLLCPLLVPLLALAGSRHVEQQAARQAPRPTNHAEHADRGEQIFSANCARCHQAPQALAPHITGTVIMHMRVRARLSTSDEQQLLKFLAP